MQGPWVRAADDYAVSRLFITLIFVKNQATTCHEFAQRARKLCIGDMYPAACRGNGGFPVLLGRPKPSA
jgi:hypothetical protein